MKLTDISNLNLVKMPILFSKVNTIVQTRHPVIVFNRDPEFDLTFEEDFRIHELLVSLHLSMLVVDLDNEEKMNG